MTEMHSEKDVEKSGITHVSGGESEGPSHVQSEAFAGLGQLAGDMAARAARAAGGRIPDGHASGGEIMRGVGSAVSGGAAESGVLNFDIPPGKGQAAGPK